MNKTNAIKDIRRFLTSAGFVSVLDAIRVLAVAKLLGPYFAGLCMTLMVIPQVAQYLNLGTIETMTIFVPQYKAKGMMQKVDLLKSRVLNYTVLTSVTSFFMAIAYVFLFSNESAFVKQCMVLAASLIVLWEMKQFFVTDYAAEGRFLKLSWIEFLFSTLVTFFQVAAIYYSREYGFWLGLIVANVAIIGLSARDYFKHNKTWYPRIDISETIRILPMGIVMTIASVSYAPFIILARVFLAGTIGVHEVGLFLLSIIIISKLSIIPSAIAKVALPHMSYNHGEAKNFEKIFSLFMRAQFYTLAISLIVITVGIFAIQPVVERVLPGYLAGIPAAKMMLLAAIPYCLVDNANNVLLALEYKRAFMLNLVVALVLQAIISAFLYITGHISSQTVATSFIIVFTCYALLANYKVFRLKWKAMSLTYEKAISS